MLRYLIDGPKRFDELMRATPRISAKTLSRTLRYLEKAGLVERMVLNSRPVAVQYALTERGLDLEPVLKEMGRWGERWGSVTQQGVSYG